MSSGVDFKITAALLDADKELMYGKHAESDSASVAVKKEGEYELCFYPTTGETVVGFNLYTVFLEGDPALQHAANETAEQYEWEGTPIDR